MMESIYAYAFISGNLFRYFIAVIFADNFDISWIHTFLLICYTLKRPASRIFLLTNLAQLCLNAITYHAFCHLSSALF